MRGYPEVALQGRRVITNQLRKAPKILLLVTKQLLEHAWVQITWPAWSCSVSKHRVVLVYLQWVWLRESELEHEGYEAEYEQGWEKDWAHENSEKEAFLFLNHLDIGLSPLLEDCFVLDHCSLWHLLFLVSSISRIGEELRDLLFLLLCILLRLLLKVENFHIELWVRLEKDVTAPLLNSNVGHLILRARKSLNWRLWG